MFSEFIRDRMKELGLTISDLVGQTGMVRTTLEQILGGDRKCLGNTDRLARLAKALKVDIEQLRRLADLEHGLIRWLFKGDLETGKEIELRVSKSSSEALKELRKYIMLWNKFDVCPVCGAEWHRTSEQAAAIELYGKCIVCLVKADDEFNVNDIVSERMRIIREEL